VPIAYSDVPAAAWEPLAKIVLKSCYEATLLVAVRNVARAMLMLEQQQQRKRQCNSSSQDDDDDDDDENECDDTAKKIERSRRVYLTKVGVAFLVTKKNGFWTSCDMRTIACRHTAFA
jgi:hypothetical protein